MAWPSNHKAVVHSLGSKTLGDTQKVQSVMLLGSDTELEFQQHSDSLHIQLPAQAPGNYAYAFRVRFKNAGK